MTTTITGATGVNQITDDAITAAKLPAGSVLQVVHAVSPSSNVTFSTSTYTDIDLSASITPISTSSKILVSWSVQGKLGEVDGGWGTKLLRGSTSVYQSATSYDIYINQEPSMRVRSGYTHIDSPSSTSAIVYKVQVSSFLNKTVYINADGNKCFITLMEIAG